MKLTSEGKVVFPNDPCWSRGKHIISFLCGGLSRAEERALLQHIGDCPGCASFMELHKKIDAEFRSCIPMINKRNTTADVLPIYLRLVLSEERKRNVGRWLHHLGRAILFQNPEAVDMIHPGTELFSFDYCVNRLMPILNVALNDPLSEDIKLSPNYVRGTIDFVNKVRKNPTEIFNVKNVKESLDRSLEIVPDCISTVMSVGRFYYLVEDYKSSYGEFNRALSMASCGYEEWQINLQLCAASTNGEDFESAIGHIESARNISDNYHIDLHKTINYLWVGKYKEASDCLKLLDSRIEAVSPNERDQHFLRLVGNSLSRDKTFLRKVLKEHLPDGLLNKYIG